jgi:hypothetical protein
MTNNTKCLLAFMVCFTINQVSAQEVVSNTTTGIYSKMPEWKNANMVTFGKGTDNDKPKKKKEVNSKGVDIPLYLYDEVEFGGVGATVDFADGTPVSSVSGFIITERGGFLYKIDKNKSASSLHVLDGGFISGSEMILSSDGLSFTSLHFAIGNKVELRYGSFYVDDDLAINIKIAASLKADGIYGATDASSFYAGTYFSNKLGAGFIFNFEKQHTKVDLHDMFAFKMGAFFGNSLTNLGADPIKANYGNYGLTFALIY